MLISEVEFNKPQTPAQQRIASLQAQAKRAQQAVKAERARQQMVRAQQALSKAQQRESR